MASSIPNPSLIIAMSGGVDSSVSAFLMAQKYKSCKGATMLLYLNEALGISSRHPCCSFDNIRDAKKICKILGIDHEVLNFMADFEECVIKKFINVYETGGTPNPCIDCNRFMKFDLLLRNAERIATGHYAKIQRDASGRWLLSKAKDLSRDQSYVLYMLTQEQLSRIEFPLGNMHKSEVRELAEELHFINAHKHDSQDICFIPDGDYGKFIESYTGRKYPGGNFIDTSGKILGVHKGIIHYTAGQRRGLGVAAKSRLYVSKIDGNSNTITLASEGEKILYCDKIRVSGANLIAFDTM
ncbi:MAG: tRNA 2-thiouridine(34) synthase MnmA, partial [Synergistaceae bacterium]|nr:tRNA 2-thiouridine(34) synthase MnmA [Synergistaceae bacterium]